MTVTYTRLFLRRSGLIAYCSTWENLICICWGDRAVPRLQVLLEILPVQTEALRGLGRPGSGLQLRRGKTAACGPLPTQNTAAKDPRSRLAARRRLALRRPPHGTGPIAVLR